MLNIIIRGPEAQGAGVGCDIRTPGLRYKIPVFSDPDPGKS